MARIRAIVGTNDRGVLVDQIPEPIPYSGL
jgi:hypothetical protein